MNIAVEPVEETLDPGDWAELQALSHQIIDDAIAHLRDVRERPVWQEMPADVRSFFAQPLPRSPMAPGQLYAQLREKLMAYPMGNIHPRFWAWYMGSGNFAGAMGEFIAAIQGSNVGGGNHAAALMDSQVIDWCKELMGFPSSASGTLTGGGSMANFIGLNVARNVKAGVDVRELGVAAIPKPLRYYTSDQAHSCHRKAVEALGLGNQSLRRIPSAADFTMDVAALRQAIVEDRAQGFRPACIIGTAGTINTGAIDDLQALADLAREEDLWFHIDGCIGALIAIAPKNAPLVSGLERADSLAFDPHKWLHAPFEAGCTLVRDAQAHRQTFTVTPEYLERKPRGIASGPMLHDYGLQTSRAFRALKLWMAFKEQGVDKFARLIDQNIAQARYLSDLIRREPLLELAAPVTINIVCFRYRPKTIAEDAVKPLNIEIMLRLQEQGIAALTDTTIRGAHALRVAINNHRTKRHDLDLLISEILRLGAELQP
jgi:glutamate/tyrosine decarboxylase-like PLP-dependent enzyme